MILFNSVVQICFVTFVMLVLIAMLLSRDKNVQQELAELRHK